MNGAVYISFPVDIIGARSIYEPNGALAVAGYFYSGGFYCSVYALTVSNASTRGYTVARNGTAGYVSTTYMYMK